MNSLKFKGDIDLSYCHEKNHSNLGFTDPPLSLDIGGVYCQ